MNLLLAFIAFNVILIVHELGHYSVARLFGVRVLEFSLFFGPKLFSIQRGGTVYSVRCVPAGAFVRLEGEEEDVRDEQSLRSKPLPARMCIMAAGPLYNVAFAILALTVVFMIQGYVTMDIAKTSEGSAAYNAGIKPGDRIVAYDGKRVYHPMDVMTFLYVSKGKPAEVMLERNGSLATTQIRPVVQKYVIGFSPVGNTGEASVTVGTVSEGMPAQKAGLLVGDVITQLDDTKVSDLYDVIGYIGRKGAKPIDIKVSRKGGEILLQMTPVPTKQEQYDIGLQFTAREGRIAGAIQSACVYAYSVTRNTVYSIAWLITGKASINQLTGPVGLFSAISDVVKESPNVRLIILNLLNVTAFLSIAIGVANLLPIPPADGSKLLFYTVEGIRRKPLSVEKEASITLVGVIIMVLLFIVITYNDIFRLVSGK